jgi:hypothetical protein
MPCQNGTIHPSPRRAIDRTCGTHVISGLLVHANQKRPTGSAIAPTIIGGRRSSGIVLPCLTYAFVKLVAVLNAIKPAPMMIPTIKAPKGS